MTITIRNYRPEDIEGIVALVNAADAFDKLEHGTSVKEMRNDLYAPNIDAEQNVYVAEEGERLVGYAFLRLAKEPGENGFRTWFVVHPIRRGRGLEERLLAQLHTRALERLGECTTPTVNFDTFVDLRERERIAIIERYGLREVRRFWLMVRPDLDDIPQPEFPEGIEIRSYRMGEDDAGMSRADNEAFAEHWGHAEHPFEEWLHYVAQPSFKPDLTVIADDTRTGEIAGFCIIAINEEENRRLNLRRGWIDILGVRKPFRRQGLGTALILAGLRNLKKAGMEQAALGTDSENTTGATRIYERVGFRVDKTRAAFRMTLRAAPAPPERELTLAAVPWANE